MSDTRLLRRKLRRLLEIGTTIGHIDYRISDYAGSESQEDKLRQEQDRLRKEAETIIKEAC